MRSPTSFGQALDAVEAEPHGAQRAALAERARDSATRRCRRDVARCRIRLAFERALPVADAHVDRPHLDAVLARIAHQLRRRVEAHRLGVEQAAEEGVGVVALDPAADVGEQREAGGVALGKAVFAEALDLLEDALGVLARVALLDHPADQPLVERREAAAPLPRGHRAAQARRPRRR